MTYISKHQYRKQTVATGKFASLHSIEQYDIFYDLAYEGIKKNTFPLTSIPSGYLLMRKVGKHPLEDRYFNIEESCSIPPVQFSALSHSVRYSGIRLDGKAGQGVLYMGTLAGVLREATHYETNGKNGVGLSLPGRPDITRSHIDKLKTISSNTLDDKSFPYHLYSVGRQLTFADIRATALSLYLNRVLPTSGEVNEMSNQLKLMSVYCGDDYSAARGIADAVYDAGATKGISGICADSSRTDSDLNLYLSNHGDKSGGMILGIFGQPGERIQALEPVSSFPDFKALSRHLKI